MMKQIFTRIFNNFNRLDPVALIVLVLSVFYIGFQPYPNEEIYFAFSKAFIDPQWIPGNTLFTDFAGTRLLFQIIVGWLMKFISFENITFFGRIAGFILLAIPLAAIVRRLKINNVILVFWLTVFMIPQQNFFGGEWVFGGFETKTIAYVFIFWSLYFLLKEKILQSVLFAAIAIYWHMLVGGWYTLYLFIFLLLQKGINRRFIISWAWAGVILLPFVIYIYLGLMQGNENEINGVNIGYLYAYVRNPHHIGLVMSWDYFLHRNAGKVLMGCIALALTVFVYRKRLPSRFSWMTDFFTIIMLQNLLFLLVALFDKNGSVAKFYPWRGSTMAMIFFQIMTILVFRYSWGSSIYNFFKNKFHQVHKKPFYLAQMGLFLLIVMISLGFKLSDRIETSKKEKPLIEEINLLSSKLKAASAPGDMFMFLGKETLINFAIPRKSERDIYYSYSCIPSQSKSIYDWYIRGIEQGKVKGNIEYLYTGGLDEKIEFIVSDTELKTASLRQVYKSENYYLYKVLHEN